MVIFVLACDLCKFFIHPQKSRIIIQQCIRNLKIIQKLFLYVPYCVAKFTSSLIRSGLFRLFDISTMITYKTINPENSAPICMSCAYIATSIKINTMVRYKGQFKYLRSFPFNFIFVFFIFTPFKNPAK